MGLRKRNNGGGRFEGPVERYYWKEVVLAIDYGSVKGN